ncbi:glycoside hydrolase family 18 protein [Hypoxylon trugodes]|uniref:glycoside hydrolase family 18 protein n=1 Tax=Hypoxylon trugodes TaxID=326681 RepID=UPI002190B596|nr:glycoside hydrolase family 18 protein [Hypoxylon trugodes]KAI1392957.1 glycoside hydrolase family 18 protein [Hypoxylon trugodes]
MSSSSSSRRRKTSSTSNVMFTNAVYFPNYKIYSGATPGMMNYSCINHVYYAFANVAADGSVFLSDEWADTQAPCDGVQGGLGSLMHLKQKHSHLQVTLSIGGGTSNEAFPIVASNPLLRDNFAQAVRGLVDASGLDGIDINWEYPMDQQQGADFVALLAAVRTQLPEEQFYVTAALPAGRSILQNIDIAQAVPYLDFINLEAYDFYGPWTNRSGHQAQLYSLSKEETSASSGVSYLLSRGCPSRKILLGIPLYGRSFLGVTGPGHRHKGIGGEDGAFEYNSLPRKNAKESVDKRIGAASCVGGDGGFVTYDNPETVKMKAAYCKQKGLGGLFYWAGPADSREKSRSLIAAGFRALHSS